MAFKTFNEYSRATSKDPKSYLNRVAIASNNESKYKYFDTVSNIFEFNKLDDSKPLIMCDSFSFDYSIINESNVFTYGIYDIPSDKDMYSDLFENEYMPKRVNDIKDIKKLKFPIVARNENSENRYKTIGKLKKSNNLYKTFKEDIVPNTRFKAIIFKDSPICLEEVINKYKIDCNLKRFKYLNEIKSISENVYSKYNLDFYSIKLIESSKGKIYLDKIEKVSKINPYQALEIYEAAYMDFYQARFPRWVKNKIVKESVAPYFKNRQYDSMLFKTNHAIDYSKHIG